ncbi:MAG: GntR family transcriptional regulator [Clostridia bacterium]
MKNKDSTSTNKAYQYIRKAIANRDLRMGDPVFEVTIAKKLNISRTPVRDAINYLKVEGLIEKIPGKGNFVKTLSKEEIRQTYELLEGLEAMVSYLAAHHANQNDLKKLEKHIEILKCAINEDDIDSWQMADEAFHNTLCTLCNNKYIVEQLVRLSPLLHHIRLIITRNFVNKAESTREHILLYEAIKNKDANLALQITHRHLQRVREESLQFIIIL